MYVNKLSKKKKMYKLCAKKNHIKFITMQNCNGKLILKHQLSLLKQSLNNGLVIGYTKHLVFTTRYIR